MIPSMYKFVGAIDYHGRFYVIRPDYYRLYLVPGGGIIVLVILHE